MTNEFYSNGKTITIFGAEHRDVPVVLFNSVINEGEKVWRRVSVNLTGIMHDLIADGNSVILVDHDTNVLQSAEYLIELGPEAGADGGTIIAEGTLEEVEKNSIGNTNGKTAQRLCRHSR